jgi:hypothetical protein
VERDTWLTAADGPTLADKVEFLSRPEAYPHAVAGLIRREFAFPTWIFLRWSVARRRARRNAVSTVKRPAPDTSIGAEN